MATKKDLVEAYSFSRRRLVTAFVSGAPGGREVEPNRPGRAIVGGLALAVLLVAGGAVLGILKSPSTANLDKEGALVSEKETGADYLVLKQEGSDKTELRPLANITSAMLVLGADIKSEKIPREDLNDKQIGAPIGILDAPATPPQPADLVQTGWTACTGLIGAQEPAGIKVDVSKTPRTTPTPDVTFVVRTGPDDDDDFYVIAQSFAGTGRAAERAYAYPIPKGKARGRILGVLAGTASDNDILTVPQQWVNLFPTGASLRLKTFGLTAEDLSQPWEFRGQVPQGAKAKVGDLLTTSDGDYLMTKTGALKLDAFALAVYRNLQFPASVPRERYTAEQVPAGATTGGDSILADTSWPTEVRNQVRPKGQLCAQLDTPAGQQPGVVLATTDVASAASAEGVDFDDVDRSVDSGAGAFVQSGGWTGAGATSPVLVDARGYAYPVGPGAEVRNLGYAGEPVVVVPQDWLDLFEPGVALTIDAARCPPSSKRGGGCS